MSQPRKHHYCPESYLEGFTEDARRDGVLWVFDRSKSQIRKSKPKNEAHQRDFYRMDLEDGSDPFALEKDFSAIEGGAKTAIDHILSNRKLPGVKEMEYLLSFVGLLAVRTPSYRKKIGGFNEDVAKMVMDVACADEKRFEITKNRLIAEGRDVSDVSYEDMREFIDGDKYTVETHQNEHLTTMLTSASTITDCLLPRNWTVVLANGGEFICSDNPVGLNWSNPPKGVWQSPGFGLEGTEVTIPLSKGVALIGTFENLGYEAATLDAAGVATFNNKSIMRAERYIYGPRDDFEWRQEDGKVVGAKEYFAIHGARAEK